MSLTLLLLRNLKTYLFYTYCKIVDRGDFDQTVCIYLCMQYLHSISHGVVQISQLNSVGKIKYTANQHFPYIQNQHFPYIQTHLDQSAADYCDTCIMMSNFCLYVFLSIKLLISLNITEIFHIILGLHNVSHLLQICCIWKRVLLCLQSKKDH